ncbi:hypothetical protein GGI22_003353, partial [Coemansia erecta]
MSSSKFSLPFDEKLIYINGKWVQPAGQVSAKVENPDTASVIAVVPECSADDVDQAVKAAHAAFHDGPWINEYSGAQRRDAMLALADEIEQHRSEIEVIESINTGKPIGDVRGELDDTIDL